MKHLKIAGLLICLLLATSIVMADSQSEIEQDKQEISYDKKYIQRTSVTLNNFTLAFDLWHDANLKGDSKAISKYEQEIYDVIGEDIRNSYQAVSYAKLESSYSKEEILQDQSNKYNKKNSQCSFKGDQNDLSLENKHMNIKKRLLKAIKNSKSFGYRYRLLSDYQQLLHQGLKLEKVELAEDVGELHEDK